MAIFANNWPQLAWPMIIIFLNFPRPCSIRSLRAAAKTCGWILLLVITSQAHWSHIPSYCWPQYYSTALRRISILEVFALSNTSVAPFIYHVFYRSSLSYLLDRGKTFAKSLLPSFFFLVLIRQVLLCLWCYALPKTQTHQDWTTVLFCSLLLLYLFSSYIIRFEFILTLKFFGFCTKCRDTLFLFYAISSNFTCLGLMNTSLTILKTYSKAVY